MTSTKGKLAGAINPHNNTSRSLNKNIRMTQPSLRPIRKENVSNFIMNDI